jgi:hypothetical protein
VRYKVGCVNKEDSTHARLSSAKERLVETEIKLQKLLEETMVMPRAAKTIVSSAVGAALESVRAAKADLEELETSTIPLIASQPGLERK